MSISGVVAMGLQGHTDVLGAVWTMSDDKAESNSYHPLAWLGWE